MGPSGIMNKLGICRIVGEQVTRNDLPPGSFPQPDAESAVLRRILAGSSARLGHLAFEGQWAFPSQCRMSAALVIKAVDVLEDGGFGLAARLPGAVPDQLGLDSFEEGLDGCPRHFSLSNGAHG